MNLKYGKIAEENRRSAGTTQWRPRRQLRRKTECSEKTEGGKRKQRGVIDNTAGRGIVTNIGSKVATFPNSFIN